MSQCFHLRVNPWSRWVFAKPTLALLASYLTLFIVCRNIDANLIDNGTSSREIQGDTSDLGSLLSLGLQSQGLQSSEVIAELNARLEAHSIFSLNDAKRPLSISSYRAFRQGKEAAAGDGRYDNYHQEKAHTLVFRKAPKLIVKAVGDGWLRDLGLDEDHKALLRDVVPKLFAQLKALRSTAALRQGPGRRSSVAMKQRPVQHSRSTTEASLRDKIDHSIKLALHYMKILHGLFNIGPLFGNDVGLAVVQKAAFEDWRSLFRKLDLVVSGQILEADGDEDHEFLSVLATRVRAPVRTPASLNAIAWTLLSCSFGKYNIAANQLRRLGYERSEFHQHLKTAVLDTAIREANKAGIDCGVKDKIGPFLLAVEKKIELSSPIHSCTHSSSPSISPCRSRCQ